VNGYRFGDVAYCTDVSKIPDASWPLLDGLDVLVLDCLKPGASHPAHFGLDEALAVIDRVRPEAGVPDPHVALAGVRGPGGRPAATVAPAYDGLRFDF
jgi:phosphoribosyl 1,2-cyclic phosphate phosphodiesterase